MAHRRTRNSLRQLQALAVLQGGYFTAKQAARLGLRSPHLAYHQTAGTSERIAHGLYRLRDLPLHEHDELIKLSLWSRDRRDVPQAVVSHETALSLHDLGELIPEEIHLTVPPRTFRKRAPVHCRLHKHPLKHSEIEERDGFRVTSPLRTLLDVADRHSVGSDQLEKAVRSAVNRGLVRRSALIGAVRELRSAKRLTRLVRDLYGNEA